jgi:hypothetical protein
LYPRDLLAQCASISCEGFVIIGDVIIEGEALSLNAIYRLCNIFRKSRKVVSGQGHFR